MKKYIIFLSAILSGILLSIPFTYPELYFLTWIGLVPFIYAVTNSKQKYSTFFMAGSLLGTVIIFSSSYWLYYPLIEYSGLDILPAIFIYILVFFLFGLIYGIWTCFFIFIRKKNSLSPFWLAISWTAFEYLRFRFIPALPFGFIAYTQGEFSSLLQFAEFGGIYLVTFIIILFNAYIYKTIKNKKAKYLIPIIFILVIIISIGTYTSNYYNQIAEDSVVIGIVQSNLTPAEKWDVSNIEKHYNYFLKETQQLSDTKLVIWPESSLTFDIIRNQFYREKFYEKAANLKSYIQLGSLAVSNGGLQKYNSSFLIGPGAEFIGRYNKNFLVPFGEYMPMSSLVEKVSGISITSQLSGDKTTEFQLENIRWKAVICSEILYPGLVKKKINNVDFIINQSNEAWYRKGNLQEQMWTAALFRAVENRRSVLKSGNKAYGGVISASGSTIIKKHSRDLTAFSAKLPIVNKLTLYQRWGDYIGYISAIIVLSLLLIKGVLYLIYKKNIQKEY